MGQSLVSNTTTKRVTITIATDAKKSTAVDCMGMVLIGIELPAEWTTSNVTFLGSATVAHSNAVAADYKVIADEDNNVITWTAVAQNQIVLGLSASPPICGLTTLKISSTTDQAANRTCTLIFAVPNP